MGVRVYLAHDLGTSSNKAALVAESGDVLATAVAHYPLLTPAPGRVEQDPAAWWAAVRDTTHAVLARSGIAADRIEALTFSSQMQCVLPVDTEGTPLQHAISWLDARAGREAAAITGGPVRVIGYGVTRLARWLWLTNGAPSLSGRDPLARMAWLRDRQPGVWSRTACVLDAKDYLLFRTTGAFVTSLDRANVTWLMDTRDGRLCWSPSLLALTGIPVEKLPALRPCASVAGTLSAAAAAELGLPRGLRVVTGAGDVTCAAIGAGAVRDREVHLGVGTSSWITAHVPGRRIDPFAFVASIRSAHPANPLVIGHSRTAGAAVEWARRTIAIAPEGPATHQAFDAAAARSAPGAAGVLFAPWLSGEAAPLDDADVRGGFHNMTLSSQPQDLARAVLEGVALNARWVLGRVERLLGRPCDAVRIAGGGATSDVWCQVFADVLDRRVLRAPDPGFAACRGAALIAAFALGHVAAFESLGDHVPVSTAFEPRSGVAALHARQFRLLKAFYQRNKAWFALANHAGGKPPTAGSEPT